LHGVLTRFSKMRDAWMRELGKVLIK